MKDIVEEKSHVINQSILRSILINELQCEDKQLDFYFRIGLSRNNGNIPSFTNLVVIVKDLPSSKTKILSTCQHMYEIDEKKLHQLLAHHLEVNIHETTISFEYDAKFGFGAPIFDIQDILLSHQKLNLSHHIEDIRDKAQQLTNTKNKL